MRLPRGLVRVPSDPALGLDPGHDRLVAVRLVDGADALHDRGQPLDPHACIDVLRGERRQRPVRVQLVLHEDEVPELEEAVAARAGGRAPGLPAAVLVAPVVVDLGVGAARPRPSDRPEVLRARQPHDPLAREADRLPERDRGLVLAEPELRVARVHRRPDPVPVDLQVLADELGGELDCAFLEVLPEREVAEHLEEGQVVAVEPDLVDVRRAEALLRGRGQRRRRLLAAEEEWHLRLHPGRGEERRVVVRTRDQRPRGQPLVPLRLEEGEKALPEIGGRVHTVDSRCRGSSGLLPAPISSRTFSRERRIRRETCICEIPTSWAICDCVRPSQKRRWMMRRSRASRTSSPGVEHGAVLADLVLVLELPQRLERVELAVLALARRRRERNRRVRLTRLEGLEHLLLRDARRLGQLGNGRRALQLDRQPLQELREPDVELLEPAGNADRPALVPEVPLDLPDDVRGRVGGELDAAVDVEAVDRLDQADRAHLDEVLELLAAVRIATRE